MKQPLMLKQNKEIHALTIFTSIIGSMITVFQLSYCQFRLKLIWVKTLENQILYQHNQTVATVKKKKQLKMQYHWAVQTEIIYIFATFN